MRDDALVDTTEMYLKSLLELEEEGVAPVRARLVERFGQTAPTVSQTVTRLERDGLVTLGADRRLAMTPAGRTIARDVMKKHRLTEVFLDRVVGLDWELVHEEACRWEHVMSDRVAELLDANLDFPTVGPYGNPMVDDPERTEALNLVRLAVGQDRPVTVRISWIGEPLQADTRTLAHLRKCGLMPDATATVTAHGPGVLIETGSHETELHHDVAKHIFAALA